MTAIFLGLYRVVRRPGERNLLSTTLSYPATIIATLLLFPGHAEFATVVVVILAFGDGTAYFGGKLFGRTPFAVESTQDVGGYDQLRLRFRSYCESRLLGGGAQPRRVAGNGFRLWNSGGDSCRGGGIDPDLKSPTTCGLVSLPL